MRGSSEPVRIDMVDICNHSKSSVQYSISQIQEFIKQANCEHNKDEANLWLCIAKNCKIITCKNSHAYSHFKEEQHAVFLNLVTQEMLCFACPRNTVFPSFDCLEEDDDEEEEEDLSDSGIPKGLQNIGNTCYMNAALQALCNIPPIRAHFTQNYLPLFSDDKKHFLSRNFQRLIQDMCNPQGPRHLTPSGILHGIRTVHPIFRGCHQHDTQEFLRCFMDQLHDELKEHAPDVPFVINSSSKRGVHILEGMEEERDDEEDGSGDHGEGGASSGSQSEAEYETCDSGVSERSSLSDEGERASIQRKHSLSCSPSARYKIAQRPISFHGPLSPNKQKRRPIKYRSIISELFDGKLLSSVECLTCRKVSTRIETFQDLSLPIPSRDHVNMLHQGSGTFTPQSFANCSDVYKGKPTWVSWLWEWVKSWFWGPTVSLHDCLSAFFSADELKGDNMYSCEQCSKLRNGMKFSKVLDLPEILCIHLKRFRHELSFSCKIANFVSFPLTDLEMRPYLHKDSKSKVTSYNLSSVICHLGTAGGGHYTCYAINPNSGQWYELDDKRVTPVPETTVSNAEGYVLFYRKNNDRAQKNWQDAENMCMNGVEQTLMQFYVSLRWLNKLQTFAEPGPIDNSDFLCPHGAVHPSKVDIVDKITVPLSTKVWDFLFREYSGGPVCNNLYQCEICENERIALLNRANYEKNQFIKCETGETPSIVYALSTSWYLQWEAFVENLADVPGPIDNTPISNKAIGSNVLNCDCVHLSQEKWQFLWSIYGGGPEIPVKSITKGGSRSSFSSGISVERERERDKMSVSSSKAKSVESLPANVGAGAGAGDAAIPVRIPRYARTHSVSSDNVAIRTAANTAAANHRKQQSLDSVRLECSIPVDKGCSKQNQRNNEPSENDDNAYCPAYTPDELNYVPLQRTTKHSTETAL